LDIDNNPLPESKASIFNDSKIELEISFFLLTQSGIFLVSAIQPGSCIMPGKVSPDIPELVNQIAFKVIGNDLTLLRK
jgi:argininosuccinate lyase